MAEPKLTPEGRKLLDFLVLKHRAPFSGLPYTGFNHPQGPMASDFVPSASGAAGGAASTEPGVGRYPGLLTTWEPGGPHGIRPQYSAGMDLRPNAWAQSQAPNANARSFTGETAVNSYGEPIWRLTTGEWTRSPPDGWTPPALLAPKSPAGGGGGFAVTEPPGGQMQAPTAAPVTVQATPPLMRPSMQPVQQAAAPNGTPYPDIGSLIRALGLDQQAATSQTPITPRPADDEMPNRWRFPWQAP